MRCPSCQAPIRSEDTFCGSCGYRLTDQDRAAGAQAPQSDLPSPFPPMPGPPPVQIQSYASPVQQVQVVEPTYNRTAQPAYAQEPFGSGPQQVYGQVPQPNYGQAPQPVRAETYQPAKKKSNGCVIALIVALVLGLCAAVIIAGVILVPKILPSATPTPASLPVPVGGAPSLPGGGTELLVVNNLSIRICYLYVSPSSSTDWGEDWLEDIVWIEPGTSATFPITAGETVDMHAEDCDGNVIDEQFEVYVDPSGITYTLNP